MPLVRVGLVQQSCTEERGENRRKSMSGVREAQAQGAQLVVLQELHGGVYFPQVEADHRFDEAESIPGPSTEAFGALATELGVVLVISLFERRAAGLYHNTAVVLERDGSIAGTYRKTHIPDDPQYFEKFYFTPGDQGIRPIDTSVGRLGVLVCWDQWYPEAARLMALAGAEMLIYPTAIGWNPETPEEERRRDLEAWVTVQRGHAAANCLPVIVANRHGFEPDLGDGRGGLVFWGQSFITGCQGEILAQASPDRDEVLVSEIDLDQIDQVRRTWPFFRDRRIDLYGDLLRRFRDSP
jgi:N-carbamoylputrescine amidase